MNEKTFARLVASLESTDFAKVEEAANTLCALRDAKVYPLILDTLNHESAIVQRVMLWTLRNYAIADYTPFLPYLMAENDDVREAAIVLFMEGETAACKTLIEALDSEDYALQYAVVEALGQFRNPCAKAPLIASLDSPCAEVRISAAYSLSHFTDEAVTEALLSHLADPILRAAVLASLRGRTLSSDALLSVLPLMADADAAVRTSAVYVLDAVVPDSAADDSNAAVRRAVAEVTDSTAVLRKLCLDAEASVRTAAVDAAGKRGIAMDEVLIPLLHDEMPGVRRAAAAALGSSSGDAVVAALIEALSDPKPGIRAAAANSLGKIGGDAAREALIEASKVRNPILAGIVKNALNELEKRK